MFYPEPGRRARFAAWNQQEARVRANLCERLFDDALETERGHARRPIAVANDPEMRCAASPITSSER